MDFDANNPSTRLLSDLDLKALGEEVASEDRRRDADIASLQTKLADARGEAAALKEGAVRAADAHSKALAAAQRRVAALSEEHQTLQRVHRQCDPLSHELRAEHAQAMAQLKDLQRDLKESIGSGGGGKGNVESLQREVAALRDENQKLRGELQDGTSASCIHVAIPVCLNLYNRRNLPAASHLPIVLYRPSVPLSRQPHRGNPPSAGSRRWRPRPASWLRCRPVCAN